MSATSLIVLEDDSGMEWKTREQLEDEMEALRRRVAELEAGQDEHRQTREALHQSEGRWKALVSNLPLRVFCKDRSSVYVACNENFARRVSGKDRL